MCERQVHDRYRGLGVWLENDRKRSLKNYVEPLPDDDTDDDGGDGSDDDGGLEFTYDASARARSRDADYLGY